MSAPAPAPDPVKNLESKDQFEHLVKDNPNKLVVLKFYATWCGPCRLIAPKFKKMASDFIKEAIFAQVDVEEDFCEQMLDDYGVRVTPTFVLLKKGAKVASLHGNVMNELRDTVKKFVK